MKRQASPRTTNEQHLLSRPIGRPRILFVVDLPSWAHNFKTENLRRALVNDYEIRKCYQADLTEDDLEHANRILVYYWIQIEVMKPLESAFRRNRDRLLIGISSNCELEAGRREAGLALLREFASGVPVPEVALKS